MTAQYAKKRKGAQQRRWQDDPYPASGRKYCYRCPDCSSRLELHDLKDGDQGYWCHHCATGHRAGQPPLAAIQPLDPSLGDKKSDPIENETGSFGKTAQLENNGRSEGAA